MFFGSTTGGMPGTVSTASAGKESRAAARRAVKRAADMREGSSEFESQFYLGPTLGGHADNPRHGRGLPGVDSALVPYYACAVTLVSPHDPIPMDCNLDCVRGLPARLG